MNVVAMIALAVALCGASAHPGAWAQSPQTPSSSADIALYQGADRAQHLLDGAKKEGELNLYSPVPVEDMNSVTDAFSKKYGIKVKYWRSSSENVLQRIVTEARGGRFDVDVVENNAPEMEALHREKLLQEVRSPFLSQLLPAAIPAHREWVGSTIDVYVQAYNTQKVRKDELPKSYRDLLDPKWKGRLGIEAEDQAWFATLLRTLGEDKGIALFKDIIARNGISVRKGHTLLTNLVASGEVPLALTIYNYKPEQLKEKGAAIDWFTLTPVIAQFRAVGVAKKAPHPYAAVLFYDFMLNEAQAIFHHRHFVPTNTRFDSPLAKLPLTFIDPALALDKEDQWLKTYQQVVINTAKP